MNAPRSARDRLDRILTVTWRSVRFWPAASVVVLVGTLAAIVFTFTRPRVYRSETLMLYREILRPTDVVGEVGSGAADPVRKLALKLKELALSRTRLQQIIDDYKLYPDLVAERGYVDAVDEMRSHIAFRVKDGDTFGLSFEGDDPKRVQSITARLAEALIDENSKNRAQQAEAQKEALDVERKRASDELHEREAALTKFLTKHPEFVREAQHAPEPKASGADPTLLALQREAARLKERLDMPAPKKPEKQPATDPALITARDQAQRELDDAKRDLADKLSQFTEQHPDVKAARAVVAAAEDKLKRAQAALSANDQAELQREQADEGIIDRTTLQSQLTKVNEEIAAYKDKKKRQADAAAQKQQSGATWIVALETEWSQLSRDVQDARTRLGQLDDKQLQVSMSTGSGARALLEIIDPAYRPTHPVKPSRSLLLGVGLLLSIGLGMTAALALALMDDRLYDRTDVEKLELVPLLAVVPRAKEGRGG